MALKEEYFHIAMLNLYLFKKNSYMIIEMNKIFINMKIFLRFDFASLLDNRQPSLCQQSAGSLEYGSADVNKP